MKKINILGLIGVSLFVLWACSSGGNGDDSPPDTGGGDDDPIEIPNPAAASLVFPEDDSECTTGEALSASESTVTFQWNSSENTDSYLVTVTNLNTTDSFNTLANSNSAPITLQRGTPYEWFVTSRANGTNATAQSTSFRFFNEGPGIENYAPFPAEAVHPERSATLPIGTSSVTLEWSASDVDNDIVGYELYFGTDEPKNLNLLGNTTETTFDTTVTDGTIYVWMVRTLDSEDNASNSEVFSFRVDD